MKVSIIIGLYNSENTIKESIDSILNQTYKNFEIIICDDGSSDNTLNIAKKYLKEYPEKIKLLMNFENKGLAYSLNKCIEVSQGEYIARMDADDIARNDRLEKQVAFLDNNIDYAMVGSSVNLIDDKSNIWGERQMKKKPKSKDFLFFSQFIHPTIMMRKKILIEVGSYTVSKKTLRAEDYELFMRMYSFNYKGYNIPENLLLYRESVITYKKRMYKYRLDEAKVRYEGFKRLGLFPLGYLYVLKPLVVGLVPQMILKSVRNYKFI